MSGFQATQLIGELESGLEEVETVAGNLLAEKKNVVYPILNVGIEL